MSERTRYRYVLPIEMIDLNYFDFLNRFQTNFLPCLIHLVSEQYGSQNNPALLKQEPDRTLYISFDVENKPNPHYHNALHYSLSDMEMIQMEQQSVTIDNIAFQVIVVSFSPR